MNDLYRGLGLGVPALMDIAPLIARVVVGGMSVSYTHLTLPTNREV